MPIPIGAAPVRRAVGTTSSSSAARADDPNLGLGDLRTGELEPGLVLSPAPAPLALVDAAGLAIGAIGLVIGPGPGAAFAPPEGPASEWMGIELLLPDPGASILLGRVDGGPGVVGELLDGIRGVFDFVGGPMGDGTPEGMLPTGTRAKADSNGGAAL